jgi:hypothetical protein
MRRKVIDLGKHPSVELTIRPETAFFILLKAREFDEKVEQTDPDSGSNPSDDNGIDVLEDSPDDATFDELSGAIDALSDDELCDLIALIWVGRGDFALTEWDDARTSAADITRERAPRYVAAQPTVSDDLEEALSQFGYSLADYLDEH